MVINLDAKVSKHEKDIIQKYTCGLFKDTTLEFYGIKTAKIKELVNVELPVIEVGESIMDFVFLLEDDTYLHFEFQTTYNKSDLTRFAMYDLRLFERDKRNISTVVIYTANVKEADICLKIGSLSYTPEKILMSRYDGNAIYDELETKIKSGIALSDVDMIKMIFLPLMRSTMPIDEFAIKSIQLSQSISDKAKRNTCIASVFAFANRYLNEDMLKRLKEVLKMTDLATMLREDAVMEVAKNLLDMLDVETIAKKTGLTIEQVNRLKEELTLKKN